MRIHPFFDLDPNVKSSQKKKKEKTKTKFHCPFSKIISNFHKIIFFSIFKNYLAKERNGDFKRGRGGGQKGKSGTVVVNHYGLKSWKFEARPIDDMIRTDPLSARFM